LQRKQKDVLLLKPRRKAALAGKGAC